MPTYRVHNLLLHSDTPLPSLKPTADDDVDVSVWFERQPPFPWPPGAHGRLLFTDRLKTEAGVPVLEAWQERDGASFRLCYYDTTEFVIDRRGQQIWVTWGKDSSFESAAAFLTGPVIGFVLRLRGVLCLHASVVQIGGGAFAIVGPCGAGKSTIAASFATSGHAVLSDDVVALVEKGGGDFMAYPSRVQFKLWPDSVGAVYGTEADFPRLVSDTEKRVIDFPHSENDCSAAKLRAIFLLSERSHAATAPSLGRFSSAAAMIGLASHTYANYLLTPEMRKQEFETLHRLVSTVAVRTVTPGAQFSQLPALRELICQEFTSLTSSCLHRKSQIGSE